VNERLSEAELIPIIGDVHGVICGDDRFTRKVLGAAKKLRVISKWGTGIDSIDREAAHEMGIRICNTPNAFTTPVADSVMAAILCFARRTPWMDRAMKSGEWKKIPGVSLGECTLGIIGVGNIGRALARRAGGFGMMVLGSGRSVRHDATIVKFLPLVGRPCRRVPLDLDLEGVRLRFTDGSLVAIAKEALKRNTGARGLRSILENSMLDIMYDVPSQPNVREVVISEDVIYHKEKPIVVYEQQVNDAA